MGSNNLYDGMLGYLTPAAQRARETLIAIGVEPDLALAVLEVKMPDTWIYEIPEEVEQHADGNRP